jgi:UDP-2-acetamido-3-amino-2,3-dideoxy-glucuronate N-acetyltransferase
MPTYSSDPQRSVSIHISAICDNDRVGVGSSVGAYTRILPTAKIGSNCNIGDRVSIHGEVLVGDRVTIDSGAFICSGTQLGDDVKVGPNVCFSYDGQPTQQSAENCVNSIVVEERVKIGANAVISPGVRIGARAIISPGAVVTSAVPAGAAVTGNPAYISGYVDDNFVSLETVKIEVIGKKTGLLSKFASGSDLILLPEVTDLRGKLSFAEVEQYLPFQPKRYFLVYDVPSKELRGEHAHKECHQFLICVRGSITVITDNGRHKDQIEINQPRIGLHIPPLVWGIQFKYSADAVLLVLASQRYDPADYIRNYDEFLEIVRRQVLS